MMIWRISWNFIPSFCNLKIKRVVVNTQCPRCDCEEENSYHIFQQCPTVIEVWSKLNMSWVLNQSNKNIWSWLTGIFGQGNDEQLRIFCCGLWFIWFNRNQLVYEKKKVSGTEIARKVRRYILELEATKEDKLTLHSSDKCHQVFKRGRATVHFDAAFDLHHSNIEDPFTAEAYAGLQAVKLGISLGINILEVMGDSKTVIKKCQSSSIDRSVIGAIIRDIQSKKRRYQKVEFSFIPKVNNIYAHTIATEALKSGESFYLERGIPELVQNALERRNLGEERLWQRPPD
ncbi:hypothetical protein Godav_029401 [Gossypium davidsonii]|uniref:RNase H type-1 domain-containing protein n=1 Tax=Gossypium davidsonii TaxID=34287 RepID=A0A7J8TF63_GOSDV|nr:hypothetical protein [Gossypium davidsonii]